MLICAFGLDFPSFHTFGWPQRMRRLQAHNDVLLLKSIASSNRVVKIRGYFGRTELLLRTSCDPDPLRIWVSAGHQRNVFRTENDLKVPLNDGKILPSS